MIDTAVSGKIAEILLDLTRQLAAWLNSTLPKIDGNWWVSLVLPSLSHHQRARITIQGITSLQQLDLADLLRVIDRNWYALSQQVKLTNQDRHFVKEMSTVRNRWAHIDSAGQASDMAFRDIDTVQRLMEVLGGSPAQLKKVTTLKSSVMIPSSEPVSCSKEEKEPPQETVPSAKSGNVQIEVGSMVALKSDPSRKGAVILIDGQGEACQYTVFLDNETKLFYPSQIQLVEKDDLLVHIPIEQVHNLLTALQITHPSLSTLYSLNSARIDFVPYQFRPALKLIRSDRPRLLIADGVGVGKTIEAGLILRELQARSNIRSVLIICPKPLISERKWELEMRRFDERFTPLDGKSLDYCIKETDLEEEWPDKYEKAILPYSLLDENRLYGSEKGSRKRKGLLDLDPPPRFDLIIVDEAHHIRNADTFSHKAVSLLCDHAEAVVFMTATPIQLGNRDLYTLLNALRPDVVIDEETFEHMSTPNPHINTALRHIRSGGDEWNEEVRSALTDASETEWGKSQLKPNPEFEEVLSRLEEGSISREERVSMLGTVEGFHSFSRLINRTRRKDIGDFCVRKPETIEVQFTPAQKALYDELLKFEEETLSLQHGDTNIPFMMTMIRRQAASSLFGLAPFITDILARRLSQLEWMDCGDEGEDKGEGEISDELTDAADRITVAAQKLPKEDLKFDALYEVVEQKQLLANNKLIVFSTFRHTLAYLRKRLVEKGVRVGLVHGGVEDEERQTLRRRFEAQREEADTLDVLLFSEIGCEGLDYQFCDGMVNYDLPWNPMKIEQRIGRIDRRGQKSETVVIYNLITADTIDADIYYRCLSRIGVFKDSIGDCDEILGGINRAIVNIANNFSLSEEERQQKLEQLADNEIREIQEQRKLEDGEHELFGLNLPRFAMDNDVRESESPWLTAQSLERFVTHYLRSRCGKGTLNLGEKSLKTLRLSQEARALLLEDFRSLKPPEKTPMHRLWDKWLKGSEQQCAITFDSDCASDHRDAHFIMPIHPLVKQAAAFLDLSKPVYTALQVSAAEFQPGKYPFAVYVWEYKGIRPELKLVPICKDEALAEELFTFLEAGIDVSSASEIPEKELFRGLDDKHRDVWQKALCEHKARSKDICSFRRESLELSHRARLDVVQDQLDNTSNTKIRRMKESQLQNIQREYELKLLALSDGEQSSDIHTRPVLFGVVTVGS